MKTIEAYMALPYRMEIVPDTAEGGFVVSFPDLPGCLSSGETMAQALENATDAKKAWLKAALEDGLEIPKPDASEDYSGQLSSGFRRACTAVLPSIQSARGSA